MYIFTECANKDKISRILFIALISCFILRKRVRPQTCLQGQEVGKRRLGIRLDGKCCVDDTGKGCEFLRAHRIDYYHRFPPHIQISMRSTSLAMKVPGSKIIAPTALAIRMPHSILPDRKNLICIQPVR